MKIASFDVHPVFVRYDEIVTGHHVVLRLRTDDGLVYVRRGSSWAQTTQGVLVLATQQGRPR